MQNILVYIAIPTSKSLRTVKIQKVNNTFTSNENKIDVVLGVNENNSKSKFSVCNFP